MIAYNTDAPIYYRPFATMGLIVVNLLLFFVPADATRQEADVQEWAVPEQKKPQWNDADFADPDQPDANEAVGVEAPVEKVRDFRLPLIDGRGRFSRLRVRLEFGRINPIQWFTAPVLHSSIFQLVINMICLWAFGLVIEGKVGHLRFLMLYAGFAVAQSAVFQTMMVFSSGQYSGSDAVLLSLLGLAVVWAPKNSFDVWLGYWGSFDIPILIYGFIQFAFGLIGFAFAGAGGATILFQLIGLLSGIAVGFLWLNRKWVDCEGWDLLTVLRGEHGSTNAREEDEQAEQEARELVKASIDKQRSTLKLPGKSDSAEASPPQQPAEATSAAKSKRRKRSSFGKTKAKAPASDAAPVETAEERAQRRIDTMRQDLEQLIYDGRSAAAMKMLQKLRQSGVEIELEQPVAAKLIRGLIADRDFHAAIPVMTDYIERFPQQRLPVQLNLAKVLLHLEKPKRALGVLRSIEKGSLDDTSKASWSKLAAHARQQISDGVIELSD